VIAVVVSLTGQRRAVALAGAIFIPLFFFGVGCFGYFRTVFHFRQFMWALIPAAAWELQRRGTAARVVTAAIR
jgi:hypothetical protein